MPMITDTLAQHWNPDGDPHLIIQGPTGRGTGYALESIIDRAINEWDAQIDAIAVHPPSVDHSRGRGATATSVDEAAALIRAVHDDVARRYAALIAGEHEHPRRVLAIDGLSILERAAGQRWAELEREIVDVARLGSSVGLHLVITTDRTWSRPERYSMAIALLGTVPLEYQHVFGEHVDPALPVGTVRLIPTHTTPSTVRL